MAGLINRKHKKVLNGCEKIWYNKLLTSYLIVAKMITSFVKLKGGMYVKKMVLA